MCVRAGTSENRKNTEFRTILETGLREAYPGRAVADLAYEALKDTHTKHPAALGSNRGWHVRNVNGVVAWRPRTGLVSYSAPVLPYRVPPKFRY